MNFSDFSYFIVLNVLELKWYMVIQFVVGLFCGQENEVINSFVNFLYDFLIEVYKVNNEIKQKVFFIMKCLYEYNDEVVVEKVVFELQKDSKFINRIDLFNC